MGRRPAEKARSTSAGSAACAPACDPSDLLTQEEQLDEEQVIKFLTSFTSDAASQESLAAPLEAAVARMQQRMKDMSSAISSGNDHCLKNIRQASFGRNGSGVPTTSTAQTLLASACNLIREGQAAFTDCQNMLMGAVSSSVQRAAQQNFVVAKLSAMRTTELQTENAAQEAGLGIIW